MFSLQSLVLLIFIYLFSLPAYAENRIVRVGVYQNEPKVFIDETGKPSGIFVDVIEDIAKHEGWTVRYISGTWKEGLDRLSKGEIDLMSDVAITPQRERDFAFHKESVLSSWSQVYARKGSNIRMITDLNGKRALVLEESIQKQTIERLVSGFGLSLQLIPMAEYRTMFRQVSDGEADAVITNRFYGLMHAKQYGLEDTAIIFDPTPYFFAANKKTPGTVLDAIDRHLIDLKSDSGSVYYASLNRWTAGKVHFKLPFWLQVIGVLAGCILLISLVGSLILKRQVNIRTRELQAAQQRFMDIVEFLPDATFVVDQERRVIAWNQACEALTGVKKESLLGKGDHAYAEPFFGERRPILIDMLDLAMPEVRTFYPGAIHKGDRLYAESFFPNLRSGMGAHLWGVVSPLYDLDGNRCGAIETLRDVTEQKRMEEALRISERENRELVMLANSIILRWSPEGKITFMNEFGQRFFGFTETEIIGRHVVGTIVPETESTGRDLRPLMAEICANPRNFERNINENICRGGEHVWIDWTNKLVLDEFGRIKEILSIGSDITERKKAEEQIRKLNDELHNYTRELEQRVEERTAELLIAKDRAESADQIKSAFLATMSHELRTPLNSIIGFTGVMLQGLAGPLNDEQHKQMSMVQNSARHLLSLINDVLDISKIESGQLKLAVAEFDLKPSIEKMVGLASPLTAQKGIELQLELPETIGTITTDQRRLEQVILNVINNAVKFTEHGYVRIACRVEDSNYILAVSDTGIGIRTEELDKLFKPFQQLDTGLARKHEGTGLGLSICRKLMDMMGGSISVESEWEKGSTFTIRFPKQTGVRL